MIYTVGRRDIYERSLAENPVVHKVGRQSTYPGGSVWPTREAAEAYLAETGQADEFGVYGVQADWEADTVPSTGGGPWHDLLRDAVIVRLA